MREKMGLLPGIMLIGMSGGTTGYYLIDDFGFALTTALSAFISGACTIVFFGRNGAAGWGWALWGAVLATFGASAAFGVLIKPDEFYTFPIVVAQTLLDYPQSAILWVVFMSLAHLSTRYWRQY